MEPIDENTVLKENVIAIAKHHRKHCDGTDCNCSLYFLRKLLEKAGITLTDTEKREFM